MGFQELWLQAVRRKNSLLCVGIDAAEPGQRTQKALPAGVDKVEWTLSLIAQVAPYAAGIKLNRNYYKDISRREMQTLNRAIHEEGMVSIDDSKLADIGETNDAGIYHAREEGFDAITYAPFPGNTRQAAQQADKHGLGLIVLVLMSNPEYQIMKQARIGEKALYRYLAEEVAACQAAGVVIGAPSSDNHIRVEEIEEVAALLPQSLVLVPGIGAQGGELAPILKVFGDRTIANVGRAIIYDRDPAAQARAYRDSIQKLRG
jgi:orotidine-5'-phosphate decarboxylase